MKQINPADIVNLEVLKDASASAIYGSRGANGVIMVTTRRAKTGTTTIRVHQQLTLSQFSSKLDIWRDPVLMAQLSNESRKNGGLEPLYVGKINSAGVYYPSISELLTTWTTRTDWEDICFRDTPISNNTTATISSSNERTMFNLSAPDKSKLETTMFSFTALRKEIAEAYKQPAHANYFNYAALLVMACGIVYVVFW